MQKLSRKWVVTTLVAAVVIALALAGGFWQSGKAETLPTVPTVPTLPPPIETGLNPTGDLVITLTMTYFDPNNVNLHWVFTSTASPATKGLAGVTDVYIPVPDKDITLQLPDAGNTAVVKATIPAKYLTQTGSAKISLANNYGTPYQVEFGNWTLNIVMNKIFGPMIGSAK